MKCQACKGVGKFWDTYAWGLDLEAGVEGPAECYTFNCPTCDGKGIKESDDAD